MCRPTDTHAGGDTHADALLVGGVQPMLIAAPGTHAPDRQCAMSIGKHATGIRFVQLIQRGYDYECISFSPTASD